MIWKLVQEEETLADELESMSRDDSEEMSEDADSMPSESLERTADKVAAAFSSSC